MDETLPPPASPPGPRETPAAAQDSAPQAAATAPASAAVDAADAAPQPTAGKLTARNAFVAVSAAVILLAMGAGGYRLYQQHYADVAGEALRAKAYAEVTAQSARRPVSGAQTREQPARLADAGKPLLRAQLSSAPTPQARPTPQATPAARRAAAAEPVSRTQSAAAKPSARAALRAASAAPSAPVSRLGKDRQTSRNRSTARAPAATQVVTRPPPGVDALYRQRSSQQCECGLLGLICREVLKVQLCRQHNAYGKAAICPSRKPPLPIWSASIG